MAEYDRLRGLAAQNMGGPKARTIELPSFAAAGSHTFTAPLGGLYKFVLWGGGSGSNAGNGKGGSSGGYCEYIRILGAAESVAIVVGAGGGITADGSASTLTFSDGKVVTAGGGGINPNAVVGVATGGDVNIDGSLGGGGNVAGADGGGTNGGAGGTGSTNRGGGGGAPANLPYAGGKGGGANGLASCGGGGGSSGSNDASTGGAAGAVLIQLLKAL